MALAIVVLLLAAVAAVRCFRASRASSGPEKLAWGLLACGAAASAGAKCASLPAGMRPEYYAAWNSLQYFIFIGFFAAATLRPHNASARTVRPARIIDIFLLALLLVSTQYYFMSWGRRAASALLPALLGAAAGSALLSQRRKTTSPQWKRAYRLLCFASLCRSASGAIYIALSYRLPADLLDMAAFVLTAVAGTPAPEPRPLDPEETEPLKFSVWRELAVPLLVLPGLLSLSQASPAATMTLYVLLVLIRQLLVQMENRDLGINLQQESMRLRLLVDNIHDAVITEDLDGRIVFANDRFLELFGIAGPQVKRVRLDDFIHAEDQFLQTNPAARQAPERLGPKRFEFRGLRKDGGIVYLESSVAPVRVNGLVLGFQSVIRDISERRKAEDKQRELVQRLEFFVNNMPLGCIVWDLDFRIVEWNNSAARIFGWSAAEVFGQRGLELLVPQEQWPAVTAVWEELQQTKSSNHFSDQNLTKDRRLIECEWFNTSLIDQSGRVVAVASMVQDVTEKKNLEAQLRQSQKMEAVGVLAGGIAHDFNNLLTIILGNTSLALMRLGSANGASRGLRDAEKAAERATELVRQLLGFSRKSRSSPRPISLNACVEESLEMLRCTFDPRIVVEVRKEPSLWPVEADPGQMHQVLVNLCVNARDAMPEGGRLTVSTANRLLDETYCRSRPDSRPGEFVELSVSDTGHGMDGATRARIFEPFFTTKEVGKGTGLGLAMVYGIVKQHGGWITVQSEPGRSASFTIFLPRSRAVPQPEARLPEVVAEGGPETILVVDDEEMIVQLARSILEASGHHVLEARDGQQALEVFQEHREEIDLVLLDMMMPRKSGRDTLEELHRLAPEVPVVLASGYAVSGLQELTALGAKSYIQKPYRPAELTRTIRQILDSMAAFC